MKYIKKLDESFQLFRQDETTDDDYVKRVKDACYDIATSELGLSEKNSNGLGRLELVMEQIMSDRQQEFNTILVNCKQLKFRPNYCAEVMYHTIHQGRLNALAEREWMNGGFKR